MDSSGHSPLTRKARYALKFSRKQELQHVSVHDPEGAGAQCLISQDQYCKALHRGEVAQIRTTQDRSSEYPSDSAHNHAAHFTSDCHRHSADSGSCLRLAAAFFSIITFVVPL